MTKKNVDCHKIFYLIPYRQNKKIGRDPYYRKNFLYFSLIRKRMSVIIRELETGKIILLSKGADSIIAARLNLEKNESNNLEKFDATSDLLEKYASKGLRTLMLAKRVLTEEQYNEWNKKYNVNS